MSKKNNDWKRREGVVFSTSSDFEFQYSGEPSQETLPSHQQKLRVLLDTSGRAGKAVTVVSGFVGLATDLDALGRRLRSGCGVGGSVKDGEILVQGDQREKVRKLLESEGYKVR